MMNLADIRKKAKARKKSERSPEASEHREEVLDRPALEELEAPEAAPPVEEALEQEELQSEAEAVEELQLGGQEVFSAPVEPAAEEEPMPEAQTPLGHGEAQPGGAPQSGPSHEVYDPLEALFAAGNDLDLATEETYFQGLVGGPQEAVEEGAQWLTFSLGEEEYALEIFAVKEIIKPREITDIPRVPKFVLGIISLRGVIIPVFDLKSRFRLGTVETTPSARIIVCQHERKCVGLLVEKINQVVKIPSSGVEPAPSILSGLDRDLVKGVGRCQGRMLILPDLENVLNAELV